MLLVVIGVLQSVAIAVIYTHCVEPKGDGAAMLPFYSRGCSHQSPA